MSKRHYYTVEEENWIKSNVPTLVNSRVSYDKVVSMFNDKFKVNVSKSALFKKVYNLLGNYSEVHDRHKWLIENADKYPISKKGNAQFRKDYCEKFNRNVKPNAFNKIISTLKIKRMFTYTDEQRQWLIKNCKGTQYKDLAKMFNDKFKTEQTADGLRTFCTRKLGITNGLNFKFLKDAISKHAKPIGYIRETIDSGKKRYRYKINNSPNDEKNNWVCVPKEVVENNSVIPNCVEAFATLKSLEKKIYRYRKGIKND